jgi:hypothetical protein
VVRPRVACIGKEIRRKNRTSTHGHLLVSQRSLVTGFGRCAPTRVAPNLHLADDASFLNGTKPQVANLMDVRQTPTPVVCASGGSPPAERSRPVGFAAVPFIREVDHMPHQGIVTLRPSRLDVAISKRCARAATPARERSLQIMTWIADEKILFGAIGLFWLTARLRPHDEEFRREADRMLLGRMCSSILSTASARIECSCTARGMAFRVREMHGTRFHPGMRCISEPWRVLWRVLYRGRRSHWFGSACWASLPHGSCFLRII